MSKEVPVTKRRTNHSCSNSQFVYLTNAGTGDSVGILEVRYIAPLGYLSVCISGPVLDTIFLIIKYS